MPAKYPLIGIARHRIELDGEGVTTLVAGAGCPLKCKYCINREVLQKPPEWLTARELYDRVKIDNLYFRATGGGVTFGGGEALLHTQFFHAFRPLCPEWKLCAETSLNVPHAAVETAASVLDAFIIDIKTHDAALYHTYTGGDLATAWENLKWLLTNFDPEKITVRVPLIPCYNTPEDQTLTVEAVRNLGAKQIDAFSYVMCEG